MPQGWRPTHPGDPTPRWGLSKAGRLVIAITVAVGVVIAFVVIAIRPTGASESLASPAMSQEPSRAAPPWFGSQRIEMPEYRLAVTVPDDWVTFDTRVDIFSQLETAAGRIDPDVWSPEDEVHFAGLWE